MPTTAGGTGAIESDRIGDHVAELASGQNSHGGGRCFAEFVIRFCRGVFFVRGFDPYDGPMSDSVSVFPTEWQADSIGDQFILEPGSQVGPLSQQMGNAD